MKSPTTSCMLMQFFLSYRCEPEVDVLYSTWEGLLPMGVAQAACGILYVEDTLHLRQLFSGFVKGSKKLTFCLFCLSLSNECRILHEACLMSNSVWKLNTPLRWFIQSFLLHNYVSVCYLNLLLCCQLPSNFLPRPRPLGFCLHSTQSRPITWTNCDV